ncbi:hypothetical protein AMK59_6352 [Oryctes borbonicus]|uniref:Spaetzle domain-containing protein n=1 Tax=Oryctes borbonicus TaxID=1629725 RepID=A0A0T6B3S4_9SCAR|nr:hypothetical protein AMK59_6352 [Oryctes borbonicus]
MKKALVLLTFLIKMNYMMKVPTKTDYSTYTWHTYAYELGPPVPPYSNLRSQYNPPPFDFNAPAQQQQSESNLHGIHERTQGTVYPGTHFEDSSLNRASRNYRTSSGNADAVVDYHLQTRATERETYVPEERKFVDDAITYPQPHDAPAFNSHQQNPPRDQQGNVPAQTNTSPKKQDIVGHNCVYNLCEDASDYPEDLIVQQLSKSRQFDGFFNNTQIPVLTSKVFGGPENLCSSTQNTTFPRSAVNTKLVKRYIANVGDYKQGVTVETCNNKDEKCMFSENVPSQYTLTCEQRFTVIPLVTYDDDKKLLVESFESPSCCVCMYKIAS